MFYVCEKSSDGRYGIKDTFDMTVEYYTRSQLVRILESSQIKILGISYNYINRKYSFNVISFRGGYLSSLRADIVDDEFIPLLRKAGVYVDISETRYDEDRLLFETRFIGGYDAWSGDEDICDADVLDRSISNTISKVCTEFTKRTGIKVSWCTGEKAWSYFEFG